MPGSWLVWPDRCYHQGTMDHACDNIEESRIRLEAAIGCLTMASEHLKYEARAVAQTSMRLARMLFLEALATRREMTILTE